MANRSINKVTLLGNLTRDPELKYTPKNTAVCTFGVATNRSWTTNDGQTKEQAQFHRIVAWQKLAELCNQLLSKGRRVYLEGRITYRDYTDKNGQQRNITEIVLEDFIVFSDGKYSSHSGEGDTNSPEENESEKSDGDLQKEEDIQENEEDNEDVNPDDIPF